MTNELPKQTDLFDAETGIVELEGQSPTANNHTISIILDYNPESIQLTVNGFEQVPTEDYQLQVYSLAHSIVTFAQRLLSGGYTQAQLFAALNPQHISMEDDFQENMGFDDEYDGDDLDELMFVGEDGDGAVDVESDPENYQQDH